MEQALSGLCCQVIQATSDEAPGLRADVEPHLGAQHSPDLFQAPHELSKAVSAPMAVQQRAAHKAVAKAAEALKRLYALLATPLMRRRTSAAQVAPQREPRAWSRESRT